MRLPTATQARGECRAYLDIETTSLSPAYGRLTVIGLYLEAGRGGRLIQLVGDDITPASVRAIMQHVTTLYTYNGSRFDLPYIEAKLGLDPARHRLHQDLMYDCWRKRLYGGLKAVERQLGIPRILTGVDGQAAVALWHRYQRRGDQEALRTLLAYNREDVMNLKLLKHKLRLD